MSRFKELDIATEKYRMAVEWAIFGEWLPAASPESDSFWRDMRRLSKHKYPESRFTRTNLTPNQRKRGRDE